MSCDVFSGEAAKNLLRGRRICFFGDSNTRALYKDLLWLLEDGRLIPHKRLQIKNEVSHANDIRLSDCELHSGRSYREIRSYEEDPFISFYFITRLNLPDFITFLKGLRQPPDIVLINSCVWDVTRWGFNGVHEYKINVEETFRTFQKYLPTTTRIIWLTTLPASFKSKGGFFAKEVQFLRNLLPWHIIFANNYVRTVAESFKFDVLDLYYSFRLIQNELVKDGIHWSPVAVRHATNLLLTHIAVASGEHLPGIFKLDEEFLRSSHVLEQVEFNIWQKDTCINNFEDASFVIDSRPLPRRKRASHSRYNNNYYSRNGNTGRVSRLQQRPVHMNFNFR